MRRSGARPWGAVAILLAACAASPPPPPRTTETGQQAVPDSLRWSRSAEYAALCLQVFNLALERLRAAPASVGELPRAVVMDLDETVLDNFGFQLELAQDGAAFDPVRWNAWVARDEAGLVPGALAFVEGARALGLEVVFLSNRNEASREATLSTLRRLGIVAPEVEPPLYLKRDTSDKEPRRQAVEARFHVVAYFGDNLADFDVGFEADARGGADAAWRRACSLRERWGVQWFVLPNPMYGGWKHGANAPLTTAPAPCP